MISTALLRKTVRPRCRSFDPKNDKMLDAADSTNPAPPNYYLSKATPLSEGTPD